jgi:glycine betaine catabolism A
MRTELAAPLSIGSVSSLLDGDFAAARTLPAEAYLSDELLDWERRNIFDPSWVAVGRSDLVPQAGSQQAIRMGQLGILLVRNEEGEVRAFHNACRHRGHELLREGECRRKRAIGCPYHAWVYDLDGELVRASRFTDLENFQPDEFPLIPISAEEFGGWIFLAASPPARSLSEHVGNIGDYLQEWEADQLAFGAKHEYVVKANWKLVIENYLECYHCPSIHPELCAVSDPESVGEVFDHSGMWIGAAMDLRDGMETQSLTGKSGGSRFRQLTPGMESQSRYFALFPNLLLSPHPDYVMAHRLYPVSVTETFVECAWFFPQEEVERANFDPAFAVDFWHRTNKQDFAACESVNRAMHSPGYLPGPFDRREVYVHGFQATMARAYANGAMPEPEIAAFAAL